MTTNVQEDLDRLIQDEWDYLESERKSWSLLEGDQDLEVLEHVLRCILHLDLTEKMGQEFKECVKAQNPDGGWSKISSGNKTSIWITTFVGLKLRRGNMILKDPAIEAAVDKTLEFILSAQENDGHWTDPEWSHLDTTCSATCFLTIYQVTRDKKDEQRINEARKRGFDFIMNWHRASGLWKDDSFHPAGIETTAHLMQYTLIPAYFMDGVDYAEQVCREAADDLAKEQAANGSWDNENMDHSMDACRNLMLVSDSFNQKEKYFPIIEKGVHWLIENKNSAGWGDFCDEPSNIERSADGLDTLLKWRRYLTDAPMSAFWAFTK